MVLEAFGDREIFSASRAPRPPGELSFRDVIELEFATVTAPIAEVVAFLLREARIRPGFAELAREHDPLVLSSGFHELIEPLLAREDVRPEVRANRLDARPDGWRVLWRDPEPCPVCGDLCKRRSLPEGPVAYVGDGYSDRCAALRADRVFARDGLAAWLAGEGVPSSPSPTSTTWPPPWARAARGRAEPEPALRPGDPRPSRHGNTRRRRRSTCRTTTAPRSTCPSGRRAGGRRGHARSRAARGRRLAGAVAHGPRRRAAHSRGGDRRRGRHGDLVAGERRHRRRDELAIAGCSTAARTATPG